MAEYQALCGTSGWHVAHHELISAVYAVLQKYGDNVRLTYTTFGVDIMVG